MSMQSAYCLSTRKTLPNRQMSCRSAGFAASARRQAATIWSGRPLSLPHTLRSSAKLVPFSPANIAVLSTGRARNAIEPSPIAIADDLAPLRLSACRSTPGLGGANHEPGSSAGHLRPTSVARNIPLLAEARSSCARRETSRAHIIGSVSGMIGERTDDGHEHQEPRGPHGNDVVYPVFDGG